MEYRLLGRTGLHVSAICMGSLAFGREIDEAASQSIIRRALEVGINFFDTADVYGRGASEEIVGRALHDVRDRVVIASKFGGIGDRPLEPTPGKHPTLLENDPNDSGGSRYHIMNAVEGSLRRLQTDHIDLYQIHRFDSNTPLEETLRCLDDLVRAGKVRYIGCSNFAAWQVAKAEWISAREHLSHFVSVQPRYNLVYRDPEIDLLPMCLSSGLAVIPYSPLAAGFLTGKYKRGESVPADTRFGKYPANQEVYLQGKSYRVLEALGQYAQKRRVPKEQLAIAWVMSHPAVTAPIIGARTLEQFETALAAHELKMTPEEREQITKLADLA